MNIDIICDSGDPDPVHQGVTVVRLSGKVTMGVDDGLLTKVIQALVQYKKNRIVLNFASVSPDETGGLNLILGLFSALGQRFGGEIKLACVPDLAAD